jgi:hypothetical protein
MEIFFCQAQKSFFYKKYEKNTILPLYKRIVKAAPDGGLCLFIPQGVHYRFRFVPMGVCRKP